jgi:hypothetical protein
MKIVDKKENHALFKDINAGEVFKTTYDSCVYMKITSITDYDDGTIYNATALDDGDLMRFDDDEEVIPYLNSELVVKR